MSLDAMSHETNFCADAISKLPILISEQPFNLMQDMLYLGVVLGTSWLPQPVIFPPNGDCSARKAAENV